MSSETALTGGQIRAARGFLRWSAETLADKSGIGISTVKRAEGTDGAPAITRANLAAIQRTLEDAGVTFTTKGGAGVQMAAGTDRF